MPFLSEIVSNPRRPPIYEGKREEEELEELEVEDYYGVAPPSEEELPAAYPAVHVELDEYPALWKPWLRDLIVKVLGRNISYEVK